jgi:hypothetical protein
LLLTAVQRKSHDLRRHVRKARNRSRRNVAEFLERKALVGELMPEPQIVIGRVLGDCGKWHASLEEWQQCQVCENILCGRSHKAWFSRVIREFVEKKNAAAL